jgi:hypothetical protein
MKSILQVYNDKIWLTNMVGACSKLEMIQHKVPVPSMHGRMQFFFFFFLKKLRGSTQPKEENCFLVP